jgi:hypothetical protein
MALAIFLRSSGLPLASRRSNSARSSGAVGGRPDRGAASLKWHENFESGLVRYRRNTAAIRHLASFAVLLL